MIDLETMRGRMHWLALNPHNLPRIAGAPQIGNIEFWRARFEREGREARATAGNPYRAGTMAGERWNAGRAFRAGQRLYSQGFPCPIDPAGAEGWHEEWAYYLGWLERTNAA